TRRRANPRTAGGSPAAAPGAGPPPPRGRFRPVRRLGRPAATCLRPAHVGRGDRGARPVARTAEGPGGVWSDLLRPELPARPPSRRGRRALRAGQLEPVRRGPLSLLRLRLGHPRRQLRPARRVARAAPRPGVLDAPGRPGTTPAAADDARRL